LIRRRDELLSLDLSCQPVRPEGRRRLLAVWRAARRGSQTRWARYTAIVLPTAVGGVLLIIAVRHFVHDGWPLAGGNPFVIAVVGLLFLVAFGLKALGWRRLFRVGERPGALSLAAAGGGASMMGIALPGRFDEAVRVAIVRRYPNCPAGMGTICLSLFTLGLVDTLALVPMAAAAASLPGLSLGVRAGFILVAFGGVGAACVIVALPSVTCRGRLLRFRLVRWLKPRATCLRDASHALGLVFASWVVRAVALFLLLHTLGVGTSLMLAVMFLCAGAASAAIPIGPAGAATQVGAGATLLIVSGVDPSQALGFALAAQALLIVSGASIFAVAVVWRLLLGARSTLVRRTLAPAR
jgi:Lysylphosphatidylglycerol synthase TM region